MPTLEEKELEVLRVAVDKAEERAGKKLIHSEEVKEIIAIVETFLKEKKLICYGGTAINNILPVQDQFYNKDVEIPDYDFFSHSALDDAKQLADIYASKGYTDVEAKSGVHHGTYKVFVNFIPVADITYIPKNLFNAIQKDAIRVDGILYAPPDYLRMAMFLELSRPKGDVSRWEKVLKRLTLLNKNYKMHNPRCNYVDFMRGFEGSKKDGRDIYETVKNSIIDQGLVFFGGYASELYSRYMPRKDKYKFQRKSPDFDALSLDPKSSANIIKERLQDQGFHNVKVHKNKGFGEIIAPHYDITVADDTVAFIYEPLACHSYNVIRIKGRKVNVATIDTMLSFYLAFLYADRAYYDHDRIYCMAQYLFLVQSRNRLQQKGVLKRFSLQCIGTQSTLEDMRNEKSKKFEELKTKKNSKEYEEWFLRYSPGDNDKENKAIKTEAIKNKAIKNKGKKTRVRKAKKTRRKTKRNKKGMFSF